LDLPMSRSTARRFVALGIENRPKRQSNRMRSKPFVTGEPTMQWPPPGAAGGTLAGIQSLARLINRASPRVRGLIEGKQAMPQFMMVYKGQATDMSEMSEEEGAAVMAKWGVWMEKVGSALTDIGAPFAPGGTSVVDDGSMGNAAATTGYSIVEAADMSAAQGLADGHPYLSEGAGNFAIDIHELTPVPLDM